MPDAPEIILACPNCNDSDLYHRKGTGRTRSGDPKAEYRCEECGHTFDKPVERQRNNKPGGHAKYEHLDTADVELLSE